jgi:hypothetical protein
VTWSGTCALLDVQGLKSPLADKRQGVCLGLSEVIDAATKRQLDDFLTILIPAVQQALCDTDADVREAAARAFNMLHQTVGIRCVDEILPSLLAELGSSDNHRALLATYGLRGILATRSREVRTRAVSVVCVCASSVHVTL